MSDNIDYVDGVIEKKGYREKWLRHAYKHKPHPINYGIHMDTHHLISAEAVKISKLAQPLIDKGYMINDINNLVGFPATLPAACHLELQLHRGDHLYKRPNEEPYHDYVSSLISAEKSDLKACYGRTKVREKETAIHKLLDPVSELILDKINEFKLPLTDIYIRFEKKSGGGVINVLILYLQKNLLHPARLETTLIKKIIGIKIVMSLVMRKLYYIPKIRVGNQRLVYEQV